MSSLERLGPLQVLTGWASSMGAFKRNKCRPQKKVIAAALCNAGYSYREVANMVGGLSYVGARDAYIAMLTSLPEERKRERREVAIDGEDVEVEGRMFHLWLARDVESGEIMSFHASPRPTAEDGARFLSTIGALCTNRPVARIGTGQNLPKEIINLDLYFRRSASLSIVERIGKLLFPST